MKCPHDGTDLEPKDYETGVQIDVCPTCHGAWLDPGEMRAVQETIERDYSAILERPEEDGVALAIERGRQSQAQPISCPKCGEEMGRREYGYCSQVLIDECSCGTWLDAGEIRRMEVFFERRQAESSRPPAGFLARLKARWLRPG